MNLMEKKKIGLAALLILVLSAGCSTIRASGQGSTQLLQPPNSSSTDFTPPSDSSVFTVYFTQPYQADEDAWHGGPDAALVAAIDGAQESIQVAIYSFSLESIGQALIDAHERGVDVRMVMESDNMDRSMPQKLIRAGIPIVGDEGEGRMHNKFLVIDGQEVWTGSMNYTGTGAYQDYNNLVRVYSDRAAFDYQNEFEEMFTGRLFGAGSPANTPDPYLQFKNEDVAIFFSPDDGVEDKLVKLIASAQTSVDFLAYSFTSDTLAEALLERAAAGVTVRGVFDEEQAESNTGGEFEHLRDAGLDVRLDANPGQMHEKMFLIDGELVAFGSFNFSRSAEERNDENVIVADSAHLAEQFLTEFERIYQQAGR